MCSAIQTAAVLAQHVQVRTAAAWETRIGFLNHRVLAKPIPDSCYSGLDYCEAANCLQPVHVPLQLNKLS